MSKTRLALIYAAFVGIPLALLVLILHVGERVATPLSLAASPLPAPVDGGLTPAFALVLQVAIIVAVSRVAGALFRSVGQAPVIGEMFAGIVLGPSLFGWLAPGWWAFVFPPATLGSLNALSQIGILIYMFIVGLDLDLHALERQRPVAILTSHASISLPFLFGAALALFLYPRLADGQVDFTNFALFMGASMSITAFPVLARILTDRRMLSTALGSLAIACAAIDDVTGWCILAYLVLRVRVGGAASPSLWVTLLGLAAFLAMMRYSATRLFPRFETAFRREGRLTNNLLALLLLVALGSALITERLGLHLLFGAFLAGAAMPRDRAFVRQIRDRLESVSVVLLLPLYFAFTGLRTSVNLVDSHMWSICGAIVAIAVAGKLGGSMIMARLSGASWRQSTGLGILMNTRGLMELVILNVGLDIGVLPPALFSMMVLMALVTTFMTTPLLALVYPAHVHSEVADAAGALAEAERV